MAEYTSVAALEPVADALRRNQMEVHCVKTAGEVVPLLCTLLQAGDTVAVGGSRTLDEAEVLPLLRSGEYRFLDRYAAGPSAEEQRQVFLDSMGADVYLCSANAVTERGEIYCVDGNCNRIAALCFGPRSVILVVGCNKIVPDLNEAVRRVKTVAAPKNAARLHSAAPCAKTGCCTAADGDFCTDGCDTDARICCSHLTLGWQREKNRIKVVLVAEPLGF